MTFEVSDGILFFLLWVCLFIHLSVRGIIKNLQVVFHEIWRIGRLLTTEELE